MNTFYPINCLDWELLGIYKWVIAHLCKWQGHYRKHFTIRIRSANKQIIFSLATNLRTNALNMASASSGHWWEVTFVTKRQHEVLWKKILGKCSDSDRNHSLPSLTVVWTVDKWNLSLHSRRTPQLWHFPKHNLLEVKIYIVWLRLTTEKTIEWLSLFFSTTKLTPCSHKNQFISTNKNLMVTSSST